MPVGWIRACAVAAAMALPAEPAAADYDIYTNSLELTQFEPGVRALMAVFVQSWITEDNFADLERVADEYRDNRTANPSSVQALARFYGAMGHVFGGNMAITSDVGGEPISQDERYRLVDRKLDAWTAAFPDSPTPHIARAMRLSAQAWDIRGGGFAREVPGGAWRPFHDKIDEAIAYLNAHKDIASRDPHWYKLRLNLATYGQEPFETFMEIVSEGAGRYPRYYEIYFAGAFHLLPRWHGNTPALDQFIRASTEATREAEGETLYARLYWYVADHHYRDRLFTHSLIDWERFKAGAHAVLDDYPDEWNAAAFARFGCQAGDRDFAREMFEMMNDPAHPVGWPRYPAYPDMFPELKGCLDFVGL